MLGMDGLSTLVQFSVSSQDGCLVIVQGVDIFGQMIPHAPTERVACMHCDWEGAAARYCSQPHHDNGAS